jgi:hypothetical protein
MAFFRPVHLGNPPGTGRTLLTWHADSSLNPVQVPFHPVQMPIGLGFGCHAILEYLLIIHLRKKVPPGEKCPPLFSRGVGEYNELLDGQCSSMEGVGEYNENLLLASFLMKR